MNRTIEQWQKVDCEHVAKNASPAHVMYLLQDAVQDLQELARQRDELQMMLDTDRSAWAAEKTKLLCSNEHELSDAMLAELEK